MQYNLALIPHEVEDNTIAQRRSDGFVNATHMCNAVGKFFADYRRLVTTEDFLQVLAADMGIPISELVVTIRGGKPHEQGTWVHPDVAINLGQWCSPKFAVAVSRWVRDWHSSRASRNVPYHIRRYTANADKIPNSHFSILSELTMHLIAPLELQGYQLPESMVPDISEGRMFCHWLRTKKQIEPKEFPSYPHEYEDGRVVSARLYPIELYQDFRTHFFDVWIPKRMIPYFKERDVKALAYFPKAFPRLYPSAAQQLPAPTQFSRRSLGA